MSKVFIAGAKRTPIGSFLGALKGVSASDLGSYAIKGVLEQSGINHKDIDEVVLGNVLPAGQGQGVARQASIKAGLEVEVPAYSLNMVCGSGMKSVINAYLGVKAGEYQAIVAGGTESMSQAPYLIPGSTRTGHKMGGYKVGDHMLDDALTDAFEGYHMGVTAENIVERYGITREEQDAFAIVSQKRAIEAVDKGAFKDEIVPVETKVRREKVVIDTDEYPNRKTTEEKLNTLRPAFKKDGSVTAGNASGINDGASATLIVGEDYLKANNLNPLVEIVSVGQGGVDPSVMGLGPTPAIKQAMKKADISFEDIDIFELNEAFASQSLGVIKEISDAFDVSKDYMLERTNVNGGAISLGHPVGASGNRILVTLIHAMKKRKLKYGLASLCIGGGMGVAVLVKNSDID
ncbi:MAG: acetyl-CoA C-acetyltransferase [Alkalibacterium sp.]|uniref:acetyl-CoA C-acetyltransferase n=1 Tax=Alkalibacterium gilvum TaxID=1130080 RepID=UPI00265274B1|nr:acetyl-CoA C-acetyltransferase [Alkalibacterium sp.]MDN6293697.1 acetyl-CoA C-acetyltransferase [Alkalibacterium sp.]MDN6326633.1 acetyl-CoA C-acetyltransferase [Alkalibacterium sp.]MDN6397626.1 acetyl-CoA C-acetyltransferase [Alkalibacterium sp.]MDN6729037.1 acetyl-CoA C-acetyltransferase [Alkalibacterium sp.]